MKAYRILVSSGGELPEIVLPAAVPTPSALPRLFPVFIKKTVKLSDLALDKNCLK